MINGACGNPGGSAIQVNSQSKDRISSDREKKRDRDRLQKKTQLGDIVKEKERERMS